ncbi:unnamed protein product [Linum tenue]|uniref:Peroxidase n=1 Tax=Linum tenue TaxID=586396 RepID=A0AAV0R887_9ROSI|nr:unnamed protein product [Linum tenue]
MENHSLPKLHIAPLFCLLFLTSLVNCQLNYTFYDDSCPSLTKIVRYGVWTAIANDTRMAASLLRLHFHDCFVNGCDGSVLLDGGEKNALPNLNSARGFEIIDSIKSNLEKACPGVVSCTDVLTLAAREAVYLTGGPYWSLAFGRRDGLTTSETAANEQLPGPFEPLDNITRKFAAKGLDTKDVVVLSGGHTLGFAQCGVVKPRLFDFAGSGRPDPSLDASFLQSLQSTCPNRNESNSNLAPLDASSSKFDNVYYKLLVNSSGLLRSDQALMSDNVTGSMVVGYSKFPFLFYKDFGASMVKMAGIGVITGSNGDVRKNCRVVN